MLINFIQSNVDSNKEVDQSYLICLWWNVHQLYLRCCWFYHKCWLILLQMLLILLNVDQSNLRYWIYHKCCSQFCLICLWLNSSIAFEMLILPQMMVNPPQDDVDSKMLINPFEMWLIKCSSTVFEMMILPQVDQSNLRCCWFYHKC